MSKKIDKLKKEYENIEVPAEIDFAIEKGIKKGKRRKSIGREYIGIAAAVLICIMSLSIFKLKESSLSYKTYEKEPAGISLSVLGSSDSLIKILKDNHNNYISYNMRAGFGTEDLAIKSEQTEYSKTNNQVEGVDEEDTVQTDGEFIYSIDKINGCIDIVKAYPASKMELINKINLDKSFKPSGIFLYSDYLVAVGNSYSSINEQNLNINYDMKFISDKTQLVIYNINDRKNVKKVRNLEVEGGYITSRITSSKLFIVSNKYLNREIIIKDKKNGQVRIEDSAFSGEIVNSYDKIKYVNGLETGSYLNITRVDLSNMNSVSKTDTILGFSGNVYCSPDNLYLTGSSYKNNKEETLIYKYSLKYNKFTAKGTVEGTSLNQFSMDESKGYLRIATTTGNYFRISKSETSTERHNNVYILDKDLKISGSLTDLAKDERIYSVRFMGDRGYMVTYKEMDPLFVIDLKIPTKPKVLGELKIPGYSNYLHPYDENHLIGFGMDSILVTEGGEERARPTGLKISLFDVTNVSKPKELYKVNLGGEGSHSEALYNHKAFMFSKEKNILSIPVDIRNGYTDSNEKQGAAVFTISLNGIKEKGIISHSHDINRNSELYNLSIIRRTLYIDDVLYAVSNGKITANDINSLDKIKEVKLK